MTEVIDYPTTRQGVRDLDNPRRSSKVNVGRTERAACTVGGAVLAGFGLSQANMLGLILAAVGGSLVYRGISGHCAAYAAAGINTAR